MFNSHWNVGDSTLPEREREENEVRISYVAVAWHWFFFSMIRVAAFCLSSCK